MFIMLFFAIAVANLFDTVFDVLTAVLVIMADVFAAIMGTVFGLLCYVIVIGLLVTVMALIFVGFGTAVAPETVLNIKAAFDAIRKSILNLKRLQPTLRSLMIYAKKGKTLFKKVAGLTTVALKFTFPWLFLIKVIQTLPIALSVYFILLTTVERRSSMDKKSLIGIYLVMIFTFGVGFVFLMFLNFLFTRKYNLLIFKVHFYTSWGMSWAFIAYAAAITGLIIYLLDVILSSEGVGVVIHSFIFVVNNSL